jgi:uncharacterized protein YmfQ (DUF2313 family)
MARDYFSHVKALFPRGAAWNFAAPIFAQVAEAIAIEFDRVDARAEALLLEMDPRTTTELIEDWERVCGLPDPCAEAPTILADRRAAVTARLLARGDLSPSASSLQSMIEALGYDEADITIRRFHIDAFTCESECDDPLNTESAGWPFVWEFIVKSGSLDAVVVCEVSRAALSHLYLTFAFPLVFFGDGTFVRAGTAVFYDPTDASESNLAANTLGTAYFGV